ncbi:MAG: fructosamine kinase family protein [Bacteroidota bacterium]|nr:fructosamine kinase family protein [Bacteroidota bacterium]
MINETLKNDCKIALSSFYEKEVNILNIKSIDGGCINNTMLFITNIGKFILKYNLSSYYPGMLEVEAKGLRLLSNANEIKVPSVIVNGISENLQYLILEYIKSGTEPRNLFVTFGRNIAMLHSHYGQNFGLDHNNYIGSLKQYNYIHNNWIDFFIQERINKQIKIARDHNKIDNLTIKKFERLFTLLYDIFPIEKPSLVHGDLWSGNYIITSKGEPCIYDPAVYYGHREADIAMTRLFGGFSDLFYKSYNEIFPMIKGWESRLDFYNLYPLLVHLNLFGAGYLSSIQSILRKF